MMKKKFLFNLMLGIVLISLLITSLGGCIVEDDGSNVGNVGENEVITKDPSVTDDNSSENGESTTAATEENPSDDPTKLRGLKFLSATDTSGGGFEVKVSEYDVIEQHITVAITNNTKESYRFDNRKYSYRKDGSDEWKNIDDSSSKEYGLVAGATMEITVNPKYWDEDNARGIYHIKMEIYKTVTEKVEFTMSFEFTDYEVLETDIVPTSWSVIGYDILRGNALNNGITYGAATLRDPTVTDIVIPHTCKDLDIVAICESGFENTVITSLYLKSGIKEINKYAFRNCKDLKTVHFGRGVDKIGFCAFDGCTSLSKLEFNDGLKTIGSCAFVNCSSLEEISLPNSLKNIDSGAFDGCTKLKTIIFRGTKAEWEAVKKPYVWDNGTPNYTIHCTDGDIVKG